MAGEGNNGQNKKVSFKKQTLTHGKKNRYRRRKLSSSSIAVILCSVLFVAVIATSCSKIISDAPETFKDIYSGIVKPDVTESGDTVGEETVKPAFFTEVSVPTSDSVKGELILVNYEYAYTFPDTEDHLVKINDHKTDNYGVANDFVLDGAVMGYFNDLMAYHNEVTGDTCILINSTYRSLESQQAIHDSYVQSSGEEYAKAYVADPGHSEHHTGLSLDLTIRYADGTYEYMRDYANLALFNQHCIKYGFVQRYPENKFNFTHINTEPWHYRYVGIPHAYVMSRKYFCLEEYITFIKGYTTDTEILWLSETGEITAMAAESVSGNGYMIYSVPASADAETVLPIPAAATEYTVSGDNCGGFVVAAKFGEFALPEPSVPGPVVSPVN